MRERVEKALKVLIWTVVIVLGFLAWTNLEYEMDDRYYGMVIVRNELLYKSLFEKHVGKIEIVESKSEIAHKYVHFRLVEYPKTVYSCTIDDKDIRYFIAVPRFRKRRIISYHEKINDIKVNQLYYSEFENLLDEYFGEQEVMYHFSVGLGSSFNDEDPGIIEMDRDQVEQICTSDSTNYRLSIAVRAVFPNTSTIDLDEVSRDLYLYLRDTYEEMGATVTVYLAKTEDIAFFEDQDIYEYISYSDKRFIESDACLSSKLSVQFSNGCDAEGEEKAKEDSEGIINQLVEKYEEFYCYDFEIKDYACSVKGNKAVCSYTIERVKNGLNYEGVLEYENCSSIRAHIQGHKEEFKNQMHLK